MPGRRASEESTTAEVRTRVSAEVKRGLAEMAKAGYRSESAQARMVIEEAYQRWLVDRDGQAAA